MSLDLLNGFGRRIIPVSPSAPGRFPRGGPGKTYVTIYFIIFRSRRQPPEPVKNLEKNVS